MQDQYRPLQQQYGAVPKSRNPSRSRSRGRSYNRVPTASVNHPSSQRNNNKQVSYASAAKQSISQHQPSAKRSLSSNKGKSKDVPNQSSPSSSQFSSSVSSGINNALKQRISKLESILK